MLQARRKKIGVSSRKKIKQKERLTLRGRMSTRSFSLDFGLRRRVRVMDMAFFMRRQRRSRRTGNWRFRGNTGFTGLRL